MRSIEQELRELIELAVADGVGMDDIEQHLLDPADLPCDERDALWLYALGCRDRPVRRTVPIVSG